MAYSITIENNEHVLSNGTKAGYNTIINVLDSAGERVYQAVQLTWDPPTELEAYKLVTHYLLLERLRRDINA